MEKETTPSQSEWLIMEVFWAGDTSLTAREVIPAFGQSGKLRNRVGVPAGGKRLAYLPEREHVQARRPPEDKRRDDERKAKGQGKTIGHVSSQHGQPKRENQQ